MKNKNIKIILSFLLSTILIYCENEVTEVISIEYTIEAKLTNSSLNQINSFFSELNFDGKIYYFNEGKIVTPKLNYDFIVSSDTMNFIYLKLYEETDSILLGVNKLHCYATILPEFEGYYYPNQSIIYSYDFRFLNNEERYSMDISCRNKKNEKFRSVGYDKNLFGLWKLDSVAPYNKKYSSEVNLQQLKFTKENVYLNDTIVSDYHHLGYSLNLEGFTFNFHKIFINQKKMILINTYYDSYEVFYFSKLK